MIKKILKQDSLVLGLVLGIGTPWIIYGILFLLNHHLSPMILGVEDVLLKPSTMQLVAIVINVFLVRYYMVKLKYDQTGKGLLAVTFVYIIAYFANEYLLK